MQITDLPQKLYTILSDALKRTGEFIRKLLFQKDRNGHNKLTGSLRFMIALSLLLTFIIECLSRHSLWRGCTFVLTSFYVFAFNALLLFATFVPVFFLKRKIFYETLVTLTWLGFGIANCVITCFRVTPFSVIDLLNLPDVFPIISIYLDVFQIVLIVVMILLAIALVVLLALKAPKGGRNLKKGFFALLSTVLLVPSAAAFGTATKMISNEFTSLTTAYNRYGFAYCFSISLFDRGVSKPPDYSNSRMDEIISAIDRCPVEEPDSLPNVVFVQLESFFDVNDLVNVSFSENPIPYFTELSEKSIGGYLNVPVVGAGTVNTEFEILTGMNLDYFGTGEYPYKTSLMSHSCETVAYNLRELGYATHAIHNYQGAFYQRNRVYKNLGFETFASLEYMQNIEYNVSGVWPVDRILTDEIFKALGSTEQSDFVLAVSVQGHGKYPPNDLPEDYDPEIVAEFIDGTAEGGVSDIAALIYYVNQLREMDRFVHELVEKVRSYDEDTVLVFYGDHLPSLSFIESDLKNGSIYQTPYLVVSNFGLEDRVNSDCLGELESYQLAAKVLGLIDIHNGNLTKLHQYYADSEDYQLWLENLEYDMLGNNSPHYLYGGNATYYPEITEMQMGTLPITVDRWKIEEGRLIVYGENFTEWSRILIDGRLYSETELLSSGELVLSEAPEGMLTLSVAQVTDGGSSLLSESEQVVYWNIETVESEPHPKNHKHG